MWTVQYWSNKRCLFYSLHIIRLELMSLGAKIYRITIFDNWNGKRRLLTHLMKNYKFSVLKISNKYNWLIWSFIKITSLYLCKFIIRPFTEIGQKSYVRTSHLFHSLLNCWNPNSKQRVIKWINCWQLK